jgi:hypothetical protein
MRLLKTSALLAFLLVNACLLLAVLSLRVHSIGGGAAPLATLNGDMNCDGKRNLTDAISLLQYLFSQGPEPCAIAQEAGVLERLDALKDQVTALQASLSTIAPAWPPRPEDVVQFAREDGNNNSENVVYQVPEGKTFVLTNLTVGHGDNTNSEIFEAAGGVKTLRWHRARAQFVSPVGLRFASGSKVVVLFLDGSHGCSPLPCNDPEPYSLAGYLTDR